MDPSGGAEALSASWGGGERGTSRRTTDKNPGAAHRPMTEPKREILKHGGNGGKTEETEKSFKGYSADPQHSHRASIESTPCLLRIPPFSPVFLHSLRVSGFLVLPLVCSSEGIASPTPFPLLLRVH